MRGPEAAGPEPDKAMPIYLIAFRDGARHLAAAEHPSEYSAGALRGGRSLASRDAARLWFFF